MNFIYISTNLMNLYKDIIIIIASFSGVLLNHIYKPVEK